MDIRTFDHDAYLAAVEPPRYVQGQVVHTGVVLSAPEWFRLAPLLSEVGTRGVADLATIRRVTDAFFPPPTRPGFFARLCGTKATPSVADLVATLPFNLQLDALLTFANAQAAAQQWTVPGLRTKVPPGPPKTVEELKAEVLEIVQPGTGSPG